MWSRRLALSFASLLVLLILPLPHGAAAAYADGDANSTSTSTSTPAHEGSEQLAVFSLVSGLHVRAPGSVADAPWSVGAAILNDQFNANSQCAAAALPSGRALAICDPVGQCNGDAPSDGRTSLTRVYVYDRAGTDGADYAGKPTSGAWLYHTAFADNIVLGAKLVTRHNVSDPGTIANMVLGGGTCSSGEFHAGTWSATTTPFRTRFAGLAETLCLGATAEGEIVVVTPNMLYILDAFTNSRAQAFPLAIAWNSTARNIGYGCAVTAAGPHRVLVTGGTTEAGARGANEVDSSSVLAGGVFVSVDTLNVTSTSSLVVARRDHGSAAAGSRFYVAGGTVRRKAVRR